MSSRRSGGFWRSRTGPGSSPGHFQNEKDIDAYLGLEYDVIGIEEATTLTSRKFQDITTCCRSSQAGLAAADLFDDEPRRGGSCVVSDEVRGAVSGEDGKTETQVSCRRGWMTTRSTTRSIGGYWRGLAGWQKRAWLDGDWDIAAGQFFTTFRREVHVVSDFDDTRAREWFAALDYGFTHYTVVLLGCTDGGRERVHRGRARGAAVAAAEARRRCKRCWPALRAG